MNYIAELNAFYDRLELNPLPSTTIALWHALMSIANKTVWKQEFTVAVSVLMLKSGLNAQAIKRARNRLEQDGYITWKSRGGNQAAIYHLNSLVVQNTYKNVPQYEPQSVPQTEPQSEPQYEPQSVPINKDKQNKNMTVNACDRFEEFWNSYPKQTNRALAEQAYVQFLLSTGLGEEQLISATKNYAEACKILQKSDQFIKNPSNWIKDLTFDDYLPGKYKKPVVKEKEKKNTNKFTNYESQRTYDYDALEKKLLGVKSGGAWMRGMEAGRKEVKVWNVY